MADDRSFFNNVSNEGSSPIYVEDKKLSEISTNTTVASTDYVMLQDTDGAYVKISKDNFNEAVRDSFGSIVTNLDKGTSIARLLATDSSADLGSITYANLASVMGDTILTRRTRLSTFDLTTLQSAVADQNLEKYGLRVGDYTTINSHTYIIAGLNCMRGTHSYTCTSDHVGLIVLPGLTCSWNASGNTYTGADDRGAGYLYSDLHYYLENTVLPLVQTDLGSDNLLSHSKLMSSAVNTTGYNRFGAASGCSSSWTWESDCYISALTEMQVYGGTVWSSSGYDTGEADQQLEVFKHFKHTRIFGGQAVWLRDVVSASYAAYANHHGYAYADTASTTLYVAALVLFK